MSAVFSLLLAAATASTATAAPDRADGRRSDAPESEGAGRLILRSILFVPRVLTDLVFAPVRGALWLVDEYEIPERIVDVLFNDARTVGLYPTAFVETGFGANIGVRFVVRDLPAPGSRLKLTAGYGGRFKQRYRAEVRSGRWIADWFEVGLSGRYEDMPEEKFFGIGAVTPDEELRYRRRRGQGLAFIELTPARILSLTLTGLYSNSRIAAAEENPHAPVEIVGGPDVDLAYQELLVAIDTRKRSNELIVPALRSQGIYLAGSIGATEVVTEPSTQYWRWAADGEWWIDLYHGDRILAFRVYVESVTGSRAEVPFIELPRLGGPEVLRGYERDRFRDRALALASVEYRFPISEHSLGYLFVDTGRVFPSLEDFEFEHFALGFGGGIDLFSSTANLMRLQVAGSKDGDVQVNAIFGVDFDLEPRSER